MNVWVLIALDKEGYFTESKIFTSEEKARNFLKSCKFVHDRQSEYDGYMVAYNEELGTCVKGFRQKVE